MTFFFSPGPNNPGNRRTIQSQCLCANSSSRRGLKLPLSPKQENYPTVEAWQEAAAGWDHRVARSVLPMMRQWKESQELLKTREPE